MRGDGHTAYGGQSACIDAAVDLYFNTQQLPPEGTVCTQDTQFQALRGLAKAQVAAIDDRRILTGRVPGL